MKQIILVSFILLLIGNNIFAQSESYYPKYHNIKKYKVMDIKQINKAYLVSVVDDDYYKFTIVSLKTKEKGENKIKKGEEYDFLFYSIYPFPEENIVLIGGNVVTHNFYINGKQIKFQGDFDTGILVTTPNLKGLFYNKFNE